MNNNEIYWKTLNNGWNFARAIFFSCCGIFDKIRRPWVFVLSEGLHTTYQFEITERGAGLGLGRLGGGGGGGGGYSPKVGFKPTTSQP